MTDESAEEPDLAGWNFEEREAEKRTDVAAEVSGYAEARQAVALLARTVWADSDPQPAYPGSDPKRLRVVALANLGSIGVRAGCSVLLLLSSGYEPEAHPPMRRMMELYVRAKIIFDDDSGEQARRWLAKRQHGKTSTLIQRNLGVEAKRFYDALSVGAHDDIQGISFPLNPPPWIDVPDEQRSINVFPARTPDHAASITYHAARHALDLAAFVAFSRSDTLTIPGLLSGYMKAIKARLEGASGD